MWPQLALLVFSYVISAAMRPKQQQAKAASLDDIDFPQGTEGTAQVEVFGTVWVNEWMVLGVGNFRTQPVRK